MFNSSYEATMSLQDEGNKTGKRQSLRILYWERIWSKAAKKFNLKFL